MTEMKERIYPELQPTAPIMNTDDRGHSYRLSMRSRNRCGILDW